MQVASVQDRVETSFESTQSFRIVANSKAFDILSSGLYSNKIRAVVREISTNAYDAHVEVGTPERPFEIHLPNAVEPWFSVRDYGPGMNEDQINTLYTSYFDSSKTSSNDFVGALGLGSKSPFSYSSSFFITSFQGGEKKEYACFLNDERVPQVAKIGSSATEEEDGFYVQVDVDSSDFRRFAEEASSVLRPYVVKPVIHGVADFEIQGYPESLFTGDDWQIYRNRGYGRMQAWNVRYGNIEYPVQVGELRDQMSQEEFDFLESITYALEVFVDVPIGKLDIAPSRESLSYDPRTVKTLAKILLRVANEVRENLNSAVSDEPSYFEALRQYNIFRETFGNIDLVHEPTGLPIKSNLQIRNLPYIHLEEYRRGAASAYEDNVVTFHSLRQMFIYEQGDIPLIYMMDDLPEDEAESKRQRRKLIENAKRYIKQRYATRIMVFTDKERFNEEFPNSELPLLSSLPYLEPVRNHTSNGSSSSSTPMATAVFMKGFDNYPYENDFGSWKDFQNSDLYAAHKNGDVKVVYVFKKWKSFVHEENSNHTLTRDQLRRSVGKFSAAFSVPLVVIQTTKSAADQKKFKDLHLESVFTYVDALGEDFLRERFDSAALLFAQLQDQLYGSQFSKFLALNTILRKYEENYEPVRDETLRYVLDLTQGIDFNDETFSQESQKTTYHEITDFLHILRKDFFPKSYETLESLRQSHQFNARTMFKEINENFPLLIGALSYMDDIFYGHAFPHDPEEGSREAKVQEHALAYLKAVLS